MQFPLIRRLCASVSKRSKFSLDSLGKFGVAKSCEVMGYVLLYMEILRGAAVQPVAHLGHGPCRTRNCLIHEPVSDYLEFADACVLVVESTHGNANGIAPFFVRPLIAGFFSGRQVQPLTR